MKDNNGALNKQNLLKNIAIIFAHSGVTSYYQKKLYFNLFPILSAGWKCFLQQGKLPATRLLSTSLTWEYLKLS